MARRKERDSEIGFFLQREKERKRKREKNSGLEFYKGLFVPALAVPALAVAPNKNG